MNENMKYGLFFLGGTCSLGVFGDFFDADKQAKVNDVINKIKSGEIDCGSYAK